MPVSRILEDRDRGFEIRIARHCSNFLPHEIGIACRRRVQSCLQDGLGFSFVGHDILNPRFCILQASAARDYELELVIDLLRGQMGPCCLLQLQV